MKGKLYAGHVTLNPSAGAASQKKGIPRGAPSKRWCKFETPPSPGGFAGSNVKCIGGHHPSGFQSKSR